MSSIKESTKNDFVFIAGVSVISTVTILIVIGYILFKLYQVEQTSIIRADYHLQLSNASSALDYFNAIVGFLTLFALMIAGWAYLQQAKAANDNHALDLERNQNEMFNNAITQLSTDNDITSWSAGIETIIYLATSNPEDFFEKSIKMLVTAGKSVGIKLMEPGPKPTLTAKQAELNEFTKIILHAISRIRCKKNIIANYKQRFIIENFVCFLVDGKTTALNEAYFEGLTFHQCELSGIFFKDCNFYETHFVNCKCIILTDCLVSGGAIPNDITAQHYLASSPTNLFWEDSFPFVGNKNYIWSNDIGTLKDKSDLCEQRFIQINAEIHFEDWINNKSARMLSLRKFVVEKENIFKSS